MSNPEYYSALKELLYKMADDQLILGHRNSEWTGIGPVIEEDIAFGSLAQDKVGQAYNLYELLHKLGEGDPDQLAFNRKEQDFKCCHLVELPSDDYAFSLIRHFLFDHAEYIRFDMLSNSTYEPLADLAKKFRREIKYHVFHANTWVRQLGQGTEESRARMQSALNKAYPLALGIFEEGPYENVLSQEGLFSGEELLKEKWMQAVLPILQNSQLQIPEPVDAQAAMGGRKGYHTEYLAPMLEEMTEVFKIDSGAGW